MVTTVLIDKTAFNILIDFEFSKAETKMFESIIGYESAS